MSRGLRRWPLAIGLGLTAIVAAAAGAVGWLAWASLPQVRGEIELAGLERPVRVVRDAHAIPHVEAGTVRDAYLAMGFLHAQDRLWQMEFNRLVGQGRLAELLGEAALPFDRFLRTLGLGRQAEAALAQTSPATLALLQAYADGVNAAIAGYGVALPPEFILLRHRPEPWRPADSLLFQKLMALDLSLNWRTELLRARLARRLTPDRLADLWPGVAAESPVTMAALAGQPLDRLAAALPAALPPGIGSNVWVVDGSRTRTGQPLLANDPHLRLQLPGHWYLAHLEAPGLSVIGATLPSLPFVVLGRNRDIAWGFTNTGSDTQDLFVERVDPADPNRYLAPEGSEPFRRRREAIAVRGGPAVTLDVRETRHGPVVSDLVPADATEQGHVLALAWTQLLGKDRTVEAGFAIGRARDWTSFVAAVEPYQGAQQNMAFADRRGTVGMISPGLVPVRRAGDGTLPVPGWDGGHDWVGTIPAGELPRQVRPAGGLLLNANNRLVGDAYPHLLTRDWEPALRASRLQALLGDAQDLDADRFARVQLDVVSPLAQEFLPYLLAVPPAGRREREMLAGLAGWDRAMRPERPEPLLFGAWYRELSEAVYADELGPLFDDYRGLRPDFMRLVLTQRPIWCDDVATPAAETCPEQASRAFERAVADLTARYGPDWRRWRWGEAHPAVLAHRPFEESGLLRRWFSLLLPVGGDGSTVAVAQTGATRAGISFGAVHAAGYRAIYDLAAPDRSRWIAAVGQSGHPLSRHRRDMAAAWREGDYVAMTTRPDEYRRDAVGSLALLPGRPR
jgi:penicillin amidase